MMNIKPIVASLALLVSGTAFAGFHGLEEAPSCGVKLAKVQSVIDRNNAPYYAECDWFNRITLSGLVQVNAGYFSRVSNATPFARFPSPSNGGSDIWLSRANLYIDADVNSWTTAHIALGTGGANFGGAGNAAVYAANDDNLYRKAGPLDEAYVTIGNFARSPVYFRAGLEYVRYGVYERNRVPATLVQLLTETQATAVELGFVDTSGFNGALYTFRSNPKATSNSRNINNFGAQLGYDYDNGTWGTNLSIDYMLNIASAVNYLVTGVNGAPLAAGYTKTVGGLNLSAKGHYNEFDAIAQFTTALGRFAFADLPYGSKGARPAAYLLGLGYAFPTMNHDSHLGVNFQQSFDSVFAGAPGAAGVFTSGFGLPRFRVQGDYDVNVWKNTDFRLAAIWDKDYKVNQGGTNLSNFTLLGSLSVKFA